MEGIPVSKSVALSVAGMAVAGALIASPALADGGYPIYGDGGLKDEVLLAPPPITWTGFYLGAHVGGGYADSDWTSRFDSGDVVHFGDTFSHNPQGWLGGGQIGYNLQTGQAVWGIEATLSGADIDDTKRSRFDDVFLSTDIDMFWTVTGRLGYDWGRVLTDGPGRYAGAQAERLQLTGGLGCFGHGGHAIRCGYLRYQPQPDRRRFHYHRHRYVLNRHRPAQIRLGVRSDIHEGRI